RRLGAGRATRRAPWLGRARRGRVAVARALVTSWRRRATGATWRRRDPRGRRPARRANPGRPGRRSAPRPGPAERRPGARPKPGRARRPKPGSRRRRRRGRRSRHARARARRRPPRRALLYGPGSRPATSTAPADRSAPAALGRRVHELLRGVVLRDALLESAVLVEREALLDVLEGAPTPRLGRVGLARADEGPHDLRRIRSRPPARAAEERPPGDRHHRPSPPRPAPSHRSAGIDRSR